MRRSVELEALSNLERLILAQAVYELGAEQSSWPGIVKILNKHPLLEPERRPKSFWTTAVCSSLYDTMLQEEKLERTEENDAIHATVNHKLSKKYHDARYDELLHLIQEEERRFKQIASEIEEIRAGKWDDRIKAELAGEEPPNSTSEEPSKLALEEELAEDPPASPAEPRREEEEEHTDEEQDNQPQDQEPDEEADQDVKMDAPEDNPTDKGDEEEAKGMVDQGEEQEVEANAEAKASSDEDEPPQTVRRSTRRKSSASTAPPLPKARNRRQQRQDATPPPEVEAEEAVDTPRTDENPPSSPFETPTRTREGKRKASTVDHLDSGGRDSKRQRDDSELLDDDDQLESPAAHNTRSRPTRSGARSEEHLAIKRFQSVIGLVHSQISQHRNGTIFHNPIKPTEAPDYHEVVKKPMDLKTIKARIKDGVISNSLEYQRDVYLMFANAMMYNRPGSDVYTLADDMMHDAEAQIHAFRQTEGYMRAGHR